MKRGYKTYARKKIDFEDDLVIVYDDNDAMWVPNKTFAEISAAYHSGKTLVAEIETDDPALYEVRNELVSDPTVAFTKQYYNCIFAIET